MIGTNARALGIFMGLVFVGEASMQHPSGWALALSLVFGVACFCVALLWDARRPAPRPPAAAPPVAQDATYWQPPGVS